MGRRRRKRKSTNRGLFEKIEKERGRDGREQDEEKLRFFFPATYLHCQQHKRVQFIRVGDNSFILSFLLVLLVLVMSVQPSWSAVLFLRRHERRQMNGGLFERSCCSERCDYQSFLVYFHSLFIETLWDYLLTMIRVCPASSRPKCKFHSLARTRLLHEYHANNMWSIKWQKYGERREAHTHTHNTGFDVQQDYCFSEEKI